MYDLKFATITLSSVNRNCSSKFIKRSNPHLETGELYNNITTHKSTSTTNRIDIKKLVYILLSRLFQIKLYVVTRAGGEIYDSAKRLTAH